MAKNPNVTFCGKEMYSRLIRNKSNRAVAPSDLKNNPYLSALSIKRGSKRVKELVDSIRTYGWMNYPVHAYQTEDGFYILLEGNTRRLALDVAIEQGILVDYPEWDIIDMSAKINNDTGKQYTFEEAVHFIEHFDIKAPKAHTATDIIERHAGEGNAMCREICNAARDFSMSITTVSDLLTGIRGSSKESQITRVIEMTPDDELVSEGRKICEALDTMDKNRADDTKKSFKEPHCAYAFENIYRLCKRYGVEDDFLTFMKAVSCIRRPNPFSHFFDIKRENSYTDQILYLIDGSFETNNASAAPSLRKIVATLEKSGVMPAISKFHYAFRSGKSGIVLSKLYKNTI